MCDGFRPTTRCDTATLLDVKATDYAKQEARRKDVAGSSRVDYVSDGLRRHRKHRILSDN
jgi:hypothetical protein